jgi:hypothetical protein
MKDQKISIITPEPPEGGWKIGDTINFQISRDGGEFVEMPVRVISFNQDFMILENVATGTTWKQPRTYEPEKRIITKEDTDKLITISKPKGES